jgi:site-specific recombinase XerD
MAKSTGKELAIIDKKNQSMQIKDAAWKSLSTETQKSYTSDYKMFFNVIKKNPKDVVASDILAYIQYLEKNDYKNNSINRKLASLSKMFKVMAMAGEIKQNPIEVLKQFQNISYKTSKGINIALTIDDIKKVVKTDNDTSIREKKIIIFIRVLASTGMRISECINIKNSDIEVFDDKNYIIKIIGKGKKERKIYVSHILLSDIRKIFPEVKDTPYLFYNNAEKKYDRKNLWLEIHNIFKEKAGKKVHPHLLRHFFISYKISVEKQDIKAVSRYAGHSDTAITLNMYVDTELGVKEANIKI